MMPEDKYLSLSSRERFELLDHASQERGLAPSILEKDYWVCKALDVLFSPKCWKLSPSSRIASANFHKTTQPSFL